VEHGNRYVERIDCKLAEEFAIKGSSDTLCTRSLVHSESRVWSFRHSRILPFLPLGPREMLREVAEIQTSSRAHPRVRKLRSSFLSFLSRRRFYRIRSLPDRRFFRVLSIFVFFIFFSNHHNLHVSVRIEELIKPRTIDGHTSDAVDHQALSGFLAFVRNKKGTPYKVIKWKKGEKSVYCSLPPFLPFPFE